MSAKVIPFPRRYPPDFVGVTLSRCPDGWRIQHMSGGRIVEMRGLSRREVEDLHASLDLALEVTQADT